MDNYDIFSKELNEPQKKAVDLLDGPILILAGAGSGKTRVLTYRFANLVIGGHCSPEQILCVTFTNKAAKNMQSRALGILQKYNIPLYDRLWIGTFHASCVRILREEIHHLGYQPFFGIYDSGDQLSQLKKVLTNLGINDKLYPAKGFQAQINSAKTQGLTPEKLAKGSFVEFDEKMIAVYKAYEEDMKRANALDFADLLLKTLHLFENHPDVLETYKEKFRYVMVDEYQDTNHIQYRLVKKLGGEHRNVCVVGDEDQSIYSWRGADIRNILDFEKDFEDATIIKLEENYRSTKTIIEAAGHLIKNNSQRKEKTLFTSNADGEPIVIHEEEREYDEARFVAKKIASLVRDKDASYSDCAIFYRTNAQSRVLEEQLRGNSIPYRIIGGMKFFERMEIKNVVAYMKLCINPNDDVALTRVINVPARGIGKTTISRLAELANQRSVSLLEAIAIGVNEKIVHRGLQTKLAGFLKTMAQIRDAAQSDSPSEIYHRILDSTSYVEKLKLEATPEASSRIENLEELDTALRQFEKERGEEATLQAFLEEIALVSDVDEYEEDDDYVALMTLHVSKGLEFPYVFIVGMEEGLFPTHRSMDSLDPTALEEERRLAYVGMTRAEKELFLSFARSRMIWGTTQTHAPSRFLSELPSKLITSSNKLRRSSFVERHRGQFDRGKMPEKQWEKPYKKSSQDSSGFTPDYQPDYENVPQDPSDLSAPTRAFQKGHRVRHPTFGVGTIFKVEGRGDQQKVSILFNNETLKKFVVKYARLERV